MHALCCLYPEPGADEAARVGMFASSHPLVKPVSLPPSWAAHTGSCASVHHPLVLSVTEWQEAELVGPWLVLFSVP